MGIKRICSVKAVSIILRNCEDISPFPHHIHFTNANVTFKEVCLELSSGATNWLHSDRETEYPLPQPKSCFSIPRELLLGGSGFFQRLGLAALPVHPKS